MVISYHKVYILGLWTILQGDPNQKLQFQMAKTPFIKLADLTYHW